MTERRRLQKADPETLIVQDDSDPLGAVLLVLCGVAVILSAVVWAVS